MVEQGKFVDLNGDSLPDIVWIMSLDNHYTVQIFLQKNANWEKTYCYSTCNGCPHWPAVHTKTNDSSPLSLPSWNPSTLLQDVGASPFPSGNKFLFQPFLTTTSTDVLTVREAAKFLRISVAEITNLLEAGKVRGKKLAAGWRISKGALLSFLEL